jgi:chemotaxis protein MotB
MLRKTITLFVIVGLVSSCVSPKVYKDLEDKYADLKKENRAMSDELESLTKSKNESENALAKLQRLYDEAISKR